MICLVRHRTFRTETCYVRYAYTSADSETDEHVTKRLKRKIEIVNGTIITCFREAIRYG